METLSKNWLTEGLIDFEYKKYILLAYLQKVHRHFKEKKLYPDFNELIAHFKYLRELKDTEERLQSNFKKQIDHIDLNQLTVNYKPEGEEEWLREIKQVIEFGIPLMAIEIMEGKTVYDYVEKQICVEHLGILPINKNEGYFLLQYHTNKLIKAYSFNLSPISYMNEMAMGLHANYFSSFTTSLAMPLDKIKQEIIYQNPYLPNPAVYVFKAKTDLPEEETFLPIAKRLLFSSIAASTKI
jgi:hypothetical protein